MMVPRYLSFLTILILSAFTSRGFGESPSWPPALPGAVKGTVTIETKAFLKVPKNVREALRGQEPGARLAPFDVAKKPPVVEFAYHQDLGPNAVERRLWSSWGDIGVASDGSVYSGIGDHANDVGGDARCFIYRWDPEDKVLEQVVDMNQVVPPREGQPAWSKVHARIDEGADGGIYFSCTLNDGNRAKLPTYQWNDQLPGGQLYRYDPKSRQTSVVANLPPRRCTATSLLDRERNIWWCNLEAGEGNALWAVDLTSGQPAHQTPDGSVGFNRDFALARDGSIYFNGDESIVRYDPKSRKLKPMKSKFADSPGMRCSTRETQAGFIYGVTHKTNELFRYSPSNDKLTLLGPNWLSGMYTTACVLSPDERFVYFLPGSHGQAFRDGTPVVQYDIAGDRLKVLAFLAPAMEQEIGYVPAGTYGVKISPDGDTLYVNFNGHAADRLRPESMRANGFGLCGFVALHIPETER